MRKKEGIAAKLLRITIVQYTGLPVIYLIFLYNFCDYQDVSIIVSLYDYVLLLDRTLRCSDFNKLIFLKLQEVQSKILGLVQKPFFQYFAPKCANFAPKFLKSIKRNQKNNFEKTERVPKNEEFYADFRSV